MDPTSSISYPLVVTACALMAVIGLTILLSVLRQRYGTAAPHLGQLLGGIRNLVVPSAVVWFLLVYVVHYKTAAIPAKIAQTLFWMSVIWVGTGIVKLVFFESADESSWRARVPGLLINLVQVTLILVGATLVIAGVWNRNLGALLTTLGVSSLILGLALQDTLGNLFAGIALLSEMPFAKGDWIKVGELQGKVININWRAVHLVTRERDLHIVPNSVLGKEIIHNYSRPAKAHGVIVNVGFSYDDPPNEVKRMLRDLCVDVEGIMHRGVSVRTTGYQDFAVTYEIRFFIEDHLREPEIREDLMTRVWYATRRNGFTIPFPIRTVHHRPLPPKPFVDRHKEGLETLGKLPLFRKLDDDELDTLSAASSLQEYAAGDTVVREGQPGDSMYLIRSGSVRVIRARGQRAERTLAELGTGAYFGEMSLLTGEPRTATVVAKTDAVALMIPKAAISALFEARPTLVERFAADVEERSKSHDDPTEFLMVPTSEQAPAHGLGGALVGKIRAFFGMKDDEG